MNERKTMILFSVINSYIRAGEPVGSKHLAEEYSLDFSPATIRNEMSTLEKMGLLEKAHTSSGRLPSDRGYRFYVDYILDHNLNKLDREDEERLLEEFDKIYQKSSDLVSAATKLLARSTDLTAVSILIKKDTSKIVDIELLKLASRSLLFIAVFDNASIVNNRIYLDFDIEDAELLDFNEALRKTFVGRPLDKNSRLLTKSKEPVFLRNKELTQALEEILRSISLKDQAGEVTIEGLSNIFNFKESEDLDQARDFIRFFDDKENLKYFVDDGDENLRISIGDENENENLKNNTIISSSFYHSPDIEGQIGIIGLTRINYKEVIGYIKTVAELLNSGR